MKPRRGKIVEFTEKNGDVHPAIIRQANRNTNACDLTVFRYGCETYHVDVPYSDKHVALHWSWPIEELEKSVWEKQNDGER